jgi:hypothetical protein
MSEQGVVECRGVPSSKKCGNCVQSGRKCKQDFYPKEDWAKLDKAHGAVNAELVTMDNELLSLQEEFSKV